MTPGQIVDFHRASKTAALLWLALMRWFGADVIVLRLAAMAMKAFVAAACAGWLKYVYRPQP